MAFWRFWGAQRRPDRPDCDNRHIGQIVTQFLHSKESDVVKFFGRNTSNILQRVEPFLCNGSINTFPRQRISMQPYRFCWKRCFNLGRCRGIIRTIEARIVQFEGSRISERTWAPVDVVRSRYQATTTEDTAG
jgi:hypothetical protein